MSLTTQHQLSHQTRYDRFPKVFQQAKAIYPSPKKILSLGCSTGEECFTLAEKYFPGVKIVGVDLDEWSVQQAQAKNRNPNISFSTKVEGSFDLVFCVMLFFSINEEYPFNKFDRAIRELDEHVRRGGLIVIRTAQYDFMRTGSACRYAPIIRGTHIHERSGETFHDGCFRKKRLFL